MTTFLALVAQVAGCARRHEQGLCPTYTVTHIVPAGAERWLRGA